MWIKKIFFSAMLYDPRCEGGGWTERNNLWKEEGERKERWKGLDLEGKHMDVGFMSACVSTDTYMPHHGSCIEMKGQPLGVGPCLSTLIETCPFITAEASLAGSGLLGCSSLPFHLPLERHLDWRHYCTRLFRDVWGCKLRLPNLCNKCQTTSHLPKFEHLKSQISQGS